MKEKTNLYQMSQTLLSVDPSHARGVLLGLVEQLSDEVPQVNCAALTTVRRANGDCLSPSSRCSYTLFSLDQPLEIIVVVDEMEARGSPNA